MMKVCVVTGANKGIGYGIVKDLCKKFDGIVYLTARDEARGKASVESLKKDGLTARFHQLDIDSQESIDTFAKYMKDEHQGIDVLVNNAAIAFKNAATEPFGLQAEDTIRVNYFGTRNMCTKLFPILRPHARVVHVSSSAGHLLQINGAEPQATALRQQFASESLTYEKLDSLLKEFIRVADDGTWKQNGWPNSTYSVSKVGVSALTRVQQREFNADSREDLIVNCCHPGYVDTDMTSHLGHLTIEEGAVCPVYLALLPPNIIKPKGGYFWYDKQEVDWVNGPTPGHY